MQNLRPIGNDLAPPQDLAGFAVQAKRQEVVALGAGQEDAVRGQRRRRIPARQRRFPDYVLIRPELDRKSSVCRGACAVGPAKLRPLGAAKSSGSAASSEQKALRSSATHYTISSVPRKILISAGEASGDLYAANLVAKLKRSWPDAEFYGCTGPRMREAGVRTVVDAASLAVVGLVEVVAHIPRIYGEYRKLLAAAREDPPDLAILTDSPDFHLRLAGRLKTIGNPRRLPGGAAGLGLAAGPGEADAPCHRPLAVHLPIRGEIL